MSIEGCFLQSLINHTCSGRAGTNPLNTGGLFHCYMSEESICYFRGVGSILSFFILFEWKILIANTVDPDQTPHNVASDLGLHCLPLTLLLVSR